MRREPGLGNEQRIRRPRVLLGPLGDIREVDVGRNEVRRWRRGAPHVDQVRERSGTHVPSGQKPRANERGVRVHRQRIFALARGGDAFVVAREMPGHEQLFRVHAASEDVFPRSG